MTIYIVDRESVDGPETDCFTSLSLAEEWAEFIGGSVREEQPIDRASLDAMKQAFDHQHDPEKYDPADDAH